jgi:hypothetical protein
MSDKRRNGSKATKATATAGKKAPIKVRLNVRVDQEDYERLMIHAVKSHEQPGEVIGGLIRTLKRWRVQDWSSDQPAPDGSVETAGQLEATAQATA